MHNSATLDAEPRIEGDDLMSVTAGSERLGSAGYVRSNMAEFAADEQSVGQARAFVRGELAGSALVGDIELCVSELATNAVVHGSRPGAVFWVVVRRGVDRAYVAAVDSGGEREDAPCLMQAGGAAEMGRGLWLVSVYASAWGFERALTGGYRVWAEVVAP